ncbi:hypothetical protein HNR42_000930 [Deinobacterium chartae]|uniref:DUF4388 domain-containing protein n=1 Tax=Deinobacterium chartae TaxID=521158 RepID=A0A841HXD4_9DEIO|nr:DUF4388 domain-containing protein [Deinobacterium chartae]MBB6097513.1 hypothetical protein [Deinobacterium chartae]
MTTLTGDFNPTSLPGLLRYLASSHSSGLLTLRGNAFEGLLGFQSGQPFFAQAGQVIGKPAVRACLRVPGGRFEMGDLPGGLTPNLIEPLEVLLAPAYGPSSIPQLVGAIPAQTELKLQQWRVVPLIDGTRRVADIAASLGTPPETVIEVLERLEDLGLLREAPRTGSNEPLSEEIIHLLTSAARQIMGPIGDVIVEECLEDLEASGTVSLGRLSELIERVTAEIPQEHRAAFGQKLRQSGLRSV